MYHYLFVIIVVIYMELGAMLVFAFCHFHVLCLQPMFTSLSYVDQSLDRQRRYFYYLTGCELADCYFTYDMATGKSTLYIPPIEPDEVVWSGLPMTEEEALAK